MVGAGVGGLAAALFAARRGHEVTVLERDPPPRADAGADEDFLHWARPGVPHARQGHAFLALSTRVLREEAPDVVAAIRDRGAEEVPISPGAEDTNLLCRRLVYEGVLRRAVAAEPGVNLLSGVVGTGLRTGARGEGGVPHVIGVRTADGEAVDGDLVVDATGRNSRAARWLVEIGARAPVETAQPCGFSYLTQHFRLDEGRSFPSRKVPIVAELDYATTLAFPGDNGRFQLSTTVAAHDPRRHRLREVEVYRRFLESVPTMAPWLAAGTPTDEPRPMARIENRWRRLVDHLGPVVSGFVLLADAAMQTNPTFGRGVSLAFLHAQGLARLVERAADRLGLPVLFDEWTGRHLGGWYDLQVATDAVRVRQLESGLRGERVARSTDPASRVVSALAALQENDHAVRAASDRVYNLLMSPKDLMADRSVARTILAYLRTNPNAAPVPFAGPDRAAFELLTAG